MSIKWLICTPLDLLAELSYASEQTLPTPGTIQMSNTFGLINLRRSSPRLTFDDAVEVWKRRLLGESQHHIAQAFGVNQARVNEILKGRRHPGSREAALGLRNAS